MDPCISRIHSPNISPAISNCDLTKREEFSHEFNVNNLLLAGTLDSKADKVAKTLIMLMSTFIRFLNLSTSN